MGPFKYQQVRKHHDLVVSALHIQCEGQQIESGVFNNVTSLGKKLYSPLPLHLACKWIPVKFSLWKGSVTQLFAICGSGRLNISSYNL